MPDSPRQFISELMQAEQLDAVLFFGLPDIRYLCGFTGSDGVFLLSLQGSVFMTDARYQHQARQQVCCDQIHCYRNKLPEIATLLADNGYTRVGFDPRHLTVAQHHVLQQELAPRNCTLIPLHDRLTSLRAVKTSSEIAVLQAAADLNRRAFEQILPLIVPGVREKTIALELEFALKSLGGEANAFEFIVASGGRGALPHGVAGDKLINAGELVTIDFGTRLNGYHSDETVTVAIGDINGNLRQIFDIVLEAHDAAMAAAKPGIRASDLDAVARDLITQNGYGDFFGHGLGHGVGLEVHEYPALSSRNQDPLQAGMVVTIEPGIYLPDVGGVRIEDTVVITGTGCRALTSIPKQYRRF